MKTNKRKENTRSPYRLEMNGQHAGNFQDHPMALIQWCRKNNVYYRLFLNDKLIDEA